MSQQSQQFTLTPEEKAEIDQRVAEQVGTLTRHREFAAWLNHGQRALAAGNNAAYIREYLPPPHILDEYEMKRAIEEGLM
jgi:uncharacterized iron-regulated membrane protein